MLRYYVYEIQTSNVLEITQVKREQSRERIVVFWVVRSCSLAGKYRHFGGMYCLIVEVTYSYQTAVSAYETKVASILIT
jgi:hypothetical protein